MDHKFNTTKDWEKSLTRDLAEAEASFRAICERCGVNLESFDEGTMECLVDIFSNWRQLFRIDDELAAYTAFDIQLYRMHRYSKADSCEELATRRMLRDCRTKMDGGDL